MAHERGKIKYSVQLTFFTIYFLFVALMVGLLNTYPTISSREAVFSAKRGLMLSQSSVMASSLSALESLGQENVGQVMELIDVNAFDRVMVTDESGRILYDTAQTENAEGKYALFTELTRALGGEVLFSSLYDGEAFKSRAASPVVSFGEVIGAVYLFEYDSAQASVIKGIQARLRSISAGVGALALLAVFAFSKALTRRITELANAVRTVREGNYAYRLEPRGRDELTELTAEFNDMASRLQSTEELRRRFVSDASHELRTPLASIRLLSDSIVQSENMDEATMREFVADIGSEAERLQRMTEKLMKLTRMDSRAPVERVRVDIKKIAEKTLHLLAPLATAQNITIFSELEDGCCVRASEDDIYQIIFNLAENAIKYNSFGGNVFIRLSRADGRVRLIVEDTGIGIPEEDVPHIFARFYRVDKARGSDVGGSGLGLSIVHDAVMSNGGKICVERRETMGTRFIVSFPEYREEAPEDEK
jgi:signal transduction histidine kinase